MSVPLCYTFMYGCCRLHSVNLHVLSKQTFKRIQALDIQHAFKISFSRKKKKKIKKQCVLRLRAAKKSLGHQERQKGSIKATNSCELCSMETKQKGQAEARTTLKHNDYSGKCKCMLSVQSPFIQYAPQEQVRHNHLYPCFSK